VKHLPQEKQYGLFAYPNLSVFFLSAYQYFLNKFCPETASRQMRETIVSEYDFDYVNAAKSAQPRPLPVIMYSNVLV
jgi:hypothetical protein